MKSFKRKRPALTFGLRFAAVMVAAAMATFVVFAHLPPDLKQLADMHAILMIGAALVVLPVGCLFWVIEQRATRRAKREIDDAVWYAQRSRIPSSLD